MLCPQCGSEFIEGISVCPECDVDLVNARPIAVTPSLSPEPIVVLRSTRAERVAIAKSLLIDAGIEFGVRGEEVQDLFGYGRFPSGSSLFMGPIEIQVAPEHEDEARDLLVMMQDDAPDAPAELSATQAGDAEHLVPSRWSTARKAGRLVAALMLLTFAAEFVFAVAGQFLGE